MSDETKPRYIPGILPNLDEILDSRAGTISIGGTSPSLGMAELIGMANKLQPQEFIPHSVLVSPPDLSKVLSAVGPASLNGLKVEAFPYMPEGIAILQGPRQLVIINLKTGQVSEPFETLNDLMTRLP